MFKRILSLVLCLVMVAGMIPTASAFDRKFQSDPHKSVDQCCNTLRVNPLSPNYVRPNYDGFLIDITPQRVEDTFAYLDAHYVNEHPEQALHVYTGTEEDRENLLTLAQTITQGCTTNQQKADAIGAWLSRNINYDVNTSAYANDTFYRREGNCLSYANLMMFLLRSLGIPAVVGDGWRGDMKTSTVELFNNEGHAWCFVYLDGQWVLYDPLWIEGGTTDRDYMAEWIYFDTVEFVTPASDGDNLPPKSSEIPMPYWTNGNYYLYSNAFPTGTGTLSYFVNNQAYIFVSNQCEPEGSQDGRLYIDGRDKSDMEMGELYRDGWVSYGEYHNDKSMAHAYAFPNGMMADGYTMEFDGKLWYMSYDSAMPILMDEDDYWIQDGLVTMAPGYSGPWLGLRWQDGCFESSIGEVFLEYENCTPEVATVDDSGNITCHAEGYAEFRFMLKRRERNGNITLMGSALASVFVSNENRTPDYRDLGSHTHEMVYSHSIEPTCEGWGMDIYRCSGCAYTEERYTTEPLGHAYVNGICTRCGAACEFVASGICGENVTWGLREDGTLTISGAGAMFDYAPGETPWYADRNRIRDVVVSEGITTLGDHAFCDLSNVGRAAVTPAAVAANAASGGGFHLPDTLQTIGDGAFTGCSGVTEILLPAAVAAIGDNAFDSCTALESIIFTGDAPVMGDNCFDNVEASVIYPEDNATWTEEVMENYGGNITWVAMCPGHEYEEGKCVHCGEAEPYYVKWYSGTTSLNGTIDLNMYVLLGEKLVNDPNTFVRFTFQNRIVDVPMVDALHAPLANYPNRYRFSCPMFAKQVADQVIVQVMNGNAPVGDPIGYSVMQYCNNRIKKSTNANEVAMCKGLLNYATAAQMYFNYNTDNLANASLSDADKRLEKPDLSAHKYSITGEEPGIKAKSATVTMESEIRIRVYFTLTGSKSIEDYTFTIDGVEVQPRYNDKGWYIESEGIAAKHMEVMHDFCVGGITVRYSALSYVNSKLSSKDPLEVELAKALYAYYTSAEAFLG